MGSWRCFKKDNNEKTCRADAVLELDDKKTKTKNYDGELALF